MSPPASGRFVLPTEGASLPSGGLRARRIDTGAIFNSLRYRISTLEYPPGHTLKELDLSEEFGVSRTPIRQALQRLELAGLVQPVIGHGTIVKGLDLASMRDLLQFRLQLARMLKHFLDCSALEDGLSTLHAMQKKNGELTQSFSGQGFAQISHEVRWVICERIANMFMAQTWIDTYYLASRVWFLCLPDAASRFVALQGEEIAALIGAFEQGNPEAIATAIHETLQIWVAEIWKSVAEGRVPVALT